MESSARSQLSRRVPSAQSMTAWPHEWGRARGALFVLPAAIELIIMRLIDGIFSNRAQARGTTRRQADEA